MNKILIIMTIVTFLFIFVHIFGIQNINEYMVNIERINRPITWTKPRGCKFLISKVIMDIFKKYNIKETKKDNWIIHIPCSYNYLNSEINSIHPTKKFQRVFIVNNANELAGKDSIWKHLVLTYGREGAKNIMPSTYILSDKDDMDLFRKEYKPNKLYILKKNIQRQQGLKITSNLNEILTAKNFGFVIVQELLQDPYLIRGRKINMRFYLLLVCQNNEIDAYVHNEGFMYYTKKTFMKNSMEFDHNITTGYIDRWIYKINPLTHGDFRKYLDDPNRLLSDVEKDIVASNQKISKVLFERIYDLLNKVIFAIKGSVCTGSHLKTYITFQLFGCDIAINENLIPMLMECNIGPDLGSKDKRDGEIKHKVVADIFKVIKVIPDENNGFIKIFG